MKHMKHAALVIGIIALVAGAFLAMKYKTTGQANVKIQGFCLGLCGEDKNGKGFGIGIGASDKGPLIGVGPYGSKTSNKTQSNRNDA